MLDELDGGDVILADVIMQFLQSVTGDFRKGQAVQDFIGTIETPALTLDFFSHIHCSLWDGVTRYDVVL